ncbi:alpha/beta hydrolase [Actinopolyspora saharensis]|uniref:Alpha/beta hydrolase fold n=1 Tax=Actinopolyspora saharensis TaxID=995062 RepID=A0A1H0ZBD8_9ACTN|nr:alpha/beta hydrolase [Actinopolyspora saharensis]SDQ24491.1 alpha/beta hydrolase fold [Actinopolyspora saharensis]
MTGTGPTPQESIAAPHPDEAALPPPAFPTPEVRLLRGVPYAEPEGTRPPELDLWLPGRPNEPAPLVLFLHGGAWQRGRRDDMGVHTRNWSPGPFARIAAAGFAVACVDYRLSGESTFPAQLDDLRCALRWLVLRSAQLGVDTARTVAWGESAGGHLAALLALTHADPPLAGAVVWYGPSDLGTAREGYSPHDPRTPEARLLGSAPAADPERARAASPVAHVHASAPPFLLVHGEQDTVVACSHSTELAASLEASGARAELRTVPDTEHVWLGASAAVVDDIFEHSLGFAERLVFGTSPREAAHRPPRSTTEP